MADPTPSPKSTRSHQRTGSQRITRLIVAGVALVYGIIFIALNRSRVRIHFLFFTVTSRLWVGFLVCVALGVLLGQAFGAYRKRSARAGRTKGASGAA
jgi:uncharacterized integral membrane protein